MVFSIRIRIRFRIQVLNYGTVKKKEKMVLKLHESTSQLEDTGTGVFYVAPFGIKLRD